MAISSPHEITLRYHPLDIYKPFHASPARHRLLAGGLGTGKSIALCGDAIARGMAVPGLRILLSRATVPELRDTLEPVFRDVIGPDMHDLCIWRKTSGHLESCVLPNGTVILFRSIDDWQKHKSLNLALWYFDELSELGRGDFYGMSRRTRQVEITDEARAMGYNHTVPPWVRGVAAGTNPNGHDWIWDHWVNKPAESTEVWTNTSLDNPHLPQDYIDDLLALPRTWVKRFVFASFDEFSGMVYPEWDANTMVFHPPLRVQRKTPFWQALDPGTRAPTAAAWGAVHNDKLWIVAEHQEHSWDVTRHAKRFREVEKPMPPITWRVADPNAITVRDRGTMVSLKAQYRREGFFYNLGPSHQDDRLPMLGALIARDRLRISSKCPTMREQIEGYRWESLTAAMKRKIGEENEVYGPERPNKEKVDLVDCAQYLSTRLVKNPKKKVIEVKEYASEAEERAAWVHKMNARDLGLRKRVQSRNEIGVHV
jgi:hypothetical protein